MRGKALYHGGHDICDIKSIQASGGLYREVRVVCLRCTAEGLVKTELFESMINKLSQGCTSGSQKASPSRFVGQIMKVGFTI